MATRERSVLLKREQKQAIVCLLNGEDVLAVLPPGLGESMIFTVFAIAESEKLEGSPVSVLVICQIRLSNWKVYVRQQNSPQRVLRK